MKHRPLAAYARLAGAFALALASGPVQAQQDDLVAGWDFSQYAIEGFLSLDGATLNGNTLDPNHSDFDPTAGSGIESNAFGRMYLNGSFGSTPAILDPNFQIPDPFQPFIATLGMGSLTSNVDQASLGFGSQSACTQQQIEQMPFANCMDFAMVAIDPVNVVFAADRSAAPTASGAWKVAFAGRTTLGGTSQATVQFSTDGSSYANVGTANLTAADTRFEFGLGGASSPTAYVRLAFGAQAEGAEAIIDNVGIALPEPGHASFAALIVLAALRRTRRNR